MAVIHWNKFRSELMKTTDTPAVMITANLEKATKKVIAPAFMLNANLQLYNLTAARKRAQRTFRRTRHVSEVGS